MGKGTFSTVSSYSRDFWLITLLKMGRSYSTTMCHYWDMSVK